MRLDRRYTTIELLAYITGWSLLVSCFNVDQDSSFAAAFSLLGLFLLPGFLICGTLGYVAGGRRLFLPAALCGTSVWMLVNIIPIIVWNLVR